MAKKVNKKNAIIILLIAICLLLAAVCVYSLFGNKTLSGSGKFLQSTFELQSKISEYVGRTTSDTFDVYSDEEVVTGKIKDTDEEINDNEGKAMKAIVDIDKKIEKNGKVAYKINEENLKSLLDTSMPTYDGIEFYIQDGNKLKINVTNKPDWFNEDLEFLEVGKD